MLAVTDTAMMTVVNMTNLETLGQAKFNDSVKKGMLGTAHPRTIVDPITGKDAMVSFQVRVSVDPMWTFELFVMDMETMSRRIIGSVAFDEPPYVHSFGLTEHYAIYMIYPRKSFFLGPRKLLSHRFTAPFLSTYQD